MNKRFGRSLSFCVKDILDGKVKKEDVGKIVTSTAFSTPADWENGIRSYSQSYWRNYTKDEIEALISWLVQNNKIEQPRITTGKIQMLWNNSIWTDSYEDCISTLTLNW